MTTLSRELIETGGPLSGADAHGERSGSVVLRLDALGIDFRAADFPTRFIEFCEANDDYDMEVNESGDLVILPLVGFRGNRREHYLDIFMGNWEIANGGVSASQTSRFRLASGAIRGPDAAWITQERYDAATEEERETVFPGAPDSVVEIRSRSDNLAPLQRKMQLWMDGGARLGWLIDPTNRSVYVYRAGQAEPELLEDPETLGGEDVLAGFSFGVRQYIFDMQ